MDSLKKAFVAYYDQEEGISQILFFSKQVTDIYATFLLKDNKVTSEYEEVLSSQLLSDIPMPEHLASIKEGLSKIFMDKYIQKKALSYFEGVSSFPRMQEATGRMEKKLNYKLEEYSIFLKTFVDLEAYIKGELFIEIKDAEKTESIFHLEDYEKEQELLNKIRRVFSYKLSSLRVDHLKILRTYHNLLIQGLLDEDYQRKISQVLIEKTTFSENAPSYSRV